MPGGIGAGSWNEGVGEHVRTRFHFGFGASEIADRRSAPNEESLFLLPTRLVQRADSSNVRSGR
jgi:hypothetical protein